MVPERARKTVSGGITQPALTRFTLWISVIIGFTRKLHFRCASEALPSGANPDGRPCRIRHRRTGSTNADRRYRTTHLDRPEQDLINISFTLANLTFVHSHQTNPSRPPLCRAARTGPLGASAFPAGTASRRPISSTGEHVKKGVVRVLEL